jgi:hypothetical protein
VEEQQVQSSAAKTLAAMASKINIEIESRQQNAAIAELARNKIESTP